MSPDPAEHGNSIGATLKDARRRIGMDVKEAEERTKIRAKYLRALEAEDWEVLPAPAYVRGFLRTYGALLGLDGERLADEYRRGYEEPAAAASPASEPLLQRRRRNGEGEGPSRGTLIGAVAAVIVALLIALAVLGGGEDEDEPTTPVRSGIGGMNGGGGKGGGKPEKEPRVPIDFELEALGSVQVCVASRGGALVDSQVLAEGTTEQFSGERRYRVDLPDGGAVRVRGGGAEARLSAEGAASWEVNSNGISEIDYAGPDCP
jgi:cytoskeleton protein RodZ